MTKKDQVQRTIIDQIVTADFRGIVLSSVRSGKTRILLKSMMEHCSKDRAKVLVLYPNIDVKTSWTDELKKIDFPYPINFCTFRSMEKILYDEWDYIVLDEAHLIPEENKLPMAGVLCKNNKHIIFASGTYNNSTLADIMIHSQLSLIVNYTTEQAIEDGLVLDFDVYIHQYGLNRIIQRKITVGKASWWSTDERECDRLTYKFNKAKGEKSKMMAALTRMRFINSNESLITSIKQWISDNPDERFIMFTDNEDFGKRFNLPMYNSKSENDELLKQFQNEEINQLVLIKKGSAGVTYPNLRNILITSINSNGETLEQMLGRALLTDTERANIHVFVSDRDFQLRWLDSALLNIKEERIFGLKRVKS